MDVATLKSLFAYHHWVNDRLLQTAEKAPGEKLHDKIGDGYDSIHASLRHLLSAENTWAGRWQGLPPMPPGVDEQTDVPTLRQRFKESQERIAAFIDGLSDERLNADLTYTNRDGNTHRLPLWQVMLQVINHGTHHRSEVCEMLTHVGTPPPPTDLIVYYQLEADKASAAAKPD